MSIDVILNLGDDAHLNQFQIVFPNGIPTGGDDSSITLRMDQTFSLPQEIIYKYNIDFKGSIIVKTGRKEDTDKTLTVSVRVDQNWQVYDDLKAWLNAVYDPKTNTAMPDLLTRTPIAVQWLDGNNSIVKTLTYTYCKITELKITDADNSTGDPVRLELSFIYGELLDD